jgi:carbon monoxide dehydrogenase subunit G
MLKPPGTPASYLIAALLSIFLLPHPTPAAELNSAVENKDVRVERIGDSFTVDLRMYAPVPPSLAWSVLTDFERMAEFVPNLSLSQILERGENTVRVRQKGTARYGPFSSDFESTREIRLIPKREIQAHGVGGNIKRMESLMRLEAEGEGTRLEYHAEVQPDFWLPPLFGPSFVRHETAEQFSAMIREMLRRR